MEKTSRSTSEDERFFVLWFTNNLAVEHETKHTSESNVNILQRAYLYG